MLHVTLGFRSEAEGIPSKQLERQIVHAVHQIAVGLLGIGQQFSLIVTAELAIAHEHLAVDDHRSYIACLGAVNDLAEDVIDRLDMRGV
jgi:hypothetical protein